MNSGTLKYIPDDTDDTTLEPENMFTIYGYNNEIIAKRLFELSNQLIKELEECYSDVFNIHVSIQKINDNDFILKHYFFLEDENKNELVTKNFLLLQEYTILLSIYLQSLFVNTNFFEPIKKWFDSYSNIEELNIIRILKENAIKRMIDVQERKQGKFHKDECFITSLLVNNESLAKNNKSTEFMLCDNDKLLPVYSHTKKMRDLYGNLIDNLQKNIQRIYTKNKEFIFPRLRYDISNLKYPVITFTDFLWGHAVPSILMGDCKKIIDADVRRLYNKEYVSTKLRTCKNRDSTGMLDVPREIIAFRVYDYDLFHSISTTIIIPILEFSFSIDKMGLYEQDIETTEIHGATMEKELDVLVDTEGLIGTGLQNAGKKKGKKTKKNKKYSRTRFIKKIRNKNK